MNTSICIAHPIETKTYSPWRIAVKVMNQVIWYNEGVLRRAYEH